MTKSKILDAINLISEVEIRAYERVKKLMYINNRGFFLNREGKVIDHTAFDFCEIDESGISVVVYDNGYDLLDRDSLKLSWEEFYMSDSQFERHLYNVKLNLEKAKEKRRLKQKQKKLEEKQKLFKKLKKELNY